MKNRISILITFLCCTLFCYGQESVITGKIKDTKGEVSVQVSVTLKQVSDSSLLAYSYSDEKGNYKLSYSGNEKELLLTVASLGIASQTKKIPNKTQTVDFIVKEETFQLREVLIKAEKITFSKDTIGTNLLPRKRQHIATYKVNNSGNDLNKELHSFSTSSGLSPERFTNIQMPSPPNIGKNRYLFNNCQIQRIILFMNVKVWSS